MLRPELFRPNILSLLSTNWKQCACTNQLPWSKRTSLLATRCHPAPSCLHQFIASLPPLEFRLPRLRRSHVTSPKTGTYEYSCFPPFRVMFRSLFNYCSDMLLYSVMWCAAPVPVALTSACRDFLDLQVWLSHCFKNLAPPERTDVVVWFVCVCARICWWWGVNNLVMVRGCTQRDIRLRVPFHRRLGCPVAVVD